MERRGRCVSTARKIPKIEESSKDKKQKKGRDKIEDKMREGELVAVGLGDNLF